MEFFVDTTYSYSLSATILSPLAHVVSFSATIGVENVQRITHNSKQFYNYSDFDKKLLIYTSLLPKLFTDRIDVLWTVPPQNVDNQYLYIKQTQEDGSLQQINMIKLRHDQDQFTLLNLRSGTTYTVQIQAENQAGKSPMSQHL